MATQQIPRPIAAVLRRLQLLDSAATKIADRGNTGVVFACRAALPTVAQALPGLSAQSTVKRRCVSLFLVRFPDGNTAGGA